MKMRLTEVRLQRALSQKDLARAAGVTLATIRSIEARQRLPRSEMILKLARALHVLPLDLVITPIRSRVEANRPVARPGRQKTVSTVGRRGGTITLPGTHETMLTELPADLWAQGWQLLPADTRIVEDRDGDRAVAVYVRPYDQAVDDPRPDPGIVMRRDGGLVIRISTYGARSQNWDEAYADAIGRMRAVDARRHSPK